MQASFPTISTPTFASPLNPNKHRASHLAQQQSDAATAPEREASPAMSVDSTIGGGMGTGRSGSLAPNAGRAGAKGDARKRGHGSVSPAPGSTSRGKAGAGAAAHDASAHRGSSVMSDDSPLKGKNNRKRKNDAGSDGDSVSALLRAC